MYSLTIAARNHRRYSQKYYC